MKQVSAKGEFKVDITDTSFIEHARHALALNEERKSFPILHFESTDTDMGSSDGRDHLESWFVGAHADMGGGARHDGLSLYPLQWMLIESKVRGLVLEYSPPKHVKGLIQDPLKLAFPSPPPLSAPQSPTSGVSHDEPHEGEAEPWKFQYSNNVSVTMFDLRNSHQHGNLQDIPRNKLRKKKDGEPPLASHLVAINRGIFGQWSLGKRQVFGSESFGTLRGYRNDCEYMPHCLLVVTSSNIKQQSMAPSSTLQCTFSWTPTPLWGYAKPSRAFTRTWRGSEKRRA